MVRYLSEDLEIEDGDSKIIEAEIKEFLDGVESVDAAALVCEFGDKLIEKSEGSNETRMRWFIGELEKLLGEDKALIKRFKHSKVLRNLKKKVNFKSKIVLDLEEQKQQANSIKDKQQPINNTKHARDSNVSSQTVFDNTDSKKEILFEEGIPDDVDKLGIEADEKEVTISNDYPNNHTGSRKRSEKHKQSKNQRQAVNKEKQRLLQSLDF